MSSMNFKQLLPRKGGGGGRSRGGKGGKGGGSKGSPAASKGAPSSFTNSKFSNSFKLSGTKSSAAPYSDGGGKSFKIKGGPFSGRLSGSGQRVSPSIFQSKPFRSILSHEGSCIWHKSVRQRLSVRRFWILCLRSTLSLWLLSSPDPVPLLRKRRGANPLIS